MFFLRISRTYKYINVSYRSSSGHEHVFLAGALFIQVSFQLDFHFPENEWAAMYYLVHFPFIVWAKFATIDRSELIREMFFLYKT